jgi:hypothetical protein
LIGIGRTKFRRFCLGYTQLILQPNLAEHFCEKEVQSVVNTIGNVSETPGLLTRSAQLTNAGLIVETRTDKGMDAAPLR